MPEDPDEARLPVGKVSRLTGLSPDVLRAWERRYGAVRPLRSEGGTRRYREADVKRLHLLKAAIDAGHRIGEVAGLESDELERRLEGSAGGLGGEAATPALAPVLEALERLDSTEAERLISHQMAALGPVRFAREFAAPLATAIGAGWETRRLCVASEHLGSALLRALLGSALRPTAAHRGAPVVVFGTPPGEHHEIGLLVAALTALGAGADPLYLGADLPIGELAGAAVTRQAAALAVSVVALDSPEAREQLLGLRAALPSEIELWAGGAASAELLKLEGVRTMTLDAIERRVELLRVRAGG